MFRECVKMAFEGMLANKIRTFLTMLGIIIGVGAVIAMVSLGLGMQEKVKENIRKKFQDDKLPLVDEVVELDQKFREAKVQGDELRSQRKSISKKIGALMGQGKKEEAEAVRIAELKERCTKHGLNFDAENQKVLDKRARKAARKAARKGKK